MEQDCKSFSTILLNPPSQPSFSTLLLNPPAQFSCSILLLNHPSQPSCSTILLNPPSHPPVQQSFSTILLNIIVPAKYPNTPTPQQLGRLGGGYGKSRLRLWASGFYIYNNVYFPCVWVVLFYSSAPLYWVLVSNSSSFWFCRCCRRFELLLPKFQVSVRRTVRELRQFS